MKSLFFFAALLLSNFSIAQKKEFPYRHFGHFTTEQGLSGNDVQQVMQDSRGFMWFACGNGLNRFDGYNFKRYNSIAADNNSLSEGWFTGLKEDSKGIIWLSTANDGFYSFDPVTEKFAHYRNKPGNHNSLADDIVNGFDIDKSGILWLGTGSGLDAFNPTTKEFRHYRHRDKDSSTIVSNNVKSICLDEDNNLWIATVSPGVDCFNTLSQRVIRHYSFNSKVSFTGDEREINYGISKGRNGNMWFSTRKNGLIGFNVRTKKTIQYLHLFNDPNSIANNGVLSVHEDQNQNLWIVTDASVLDYYDYQSGLFLHTSLLNNTGNDPTTLGSIMEDRNSKIWLTSSNHGIFAFDTRPKQFISFQHTNDPNSIAGNSVGSFLHESKGNFLVASSGVDYFDKKTASFSALKIMEKGKNIFLNNHAMNIREDSRGNLMFALSIGLLFYNPETKDQHYYTHLENDSTTLSEVTINDIFEDSKGRYWATAWAGGLDAIDPVTARVRAFKVNAEKNSISTNSVGGIFEDVHGNLLIGSQNGGFIIFDPNKEKFNIYWHRSGDSTSLSNNIAFNFIEDKNGIVWIGTRGGGINAFDPETNKFRAFTTKDGLCSNAIFCMTKDDNKNIWIGTDNGISCFTPPQNPFDYSSKFSFRNYDKSDGLPGNEMNFFAVYKDTDGSIFFGTMNAGFFYFYPDSLKDNNYVPSVYITDFTLFSKSVGIDDTTHLLSTSIETTKEIKLNYEQNVISFSFAALNYIHPEKNKYAYKLEGFDKDWIYTDASKRFAKYTNLNANEYFFKVKGSNNDGRWNDQETTIKLIILPPYWQTWWFISFLLIVLASFAYILYRFRLNQVLKFQVIRNKIASDLHDDIGSTLNSISVYSEVAKKDAINRDEALDMIGDSSRKIIDSLSDIVWTINPAHDSFEKIILRMRSLSYNLFRAKQIEFTFRADDKLGRLKFSMTERQHIYLIFKEVINNIVKHSSASLVDIRFSLSNNLVELFIRDNGIGFNQDQNAEGNGIGNIKSRVKEINARLKIESEPGNGTTIKLTLKK